jgi:hypothetical protein
MKKVLFLAILTLFGFLIQNNSLLGATGWFQDYIIINSNNGVDTYYWIGGDPNFGTEFNDNNFGVVTSLKITGADMKYWSDTQDRGGGSFWYKITLQDGITDIVGFTEVIWSQNYLGGNNYQGIWTGNIDLLTLGLKPNTSYKLHIYAKSWDTGSGQGDMYLSNSGANYVASFTTFNADTEWDGSESTSWSEVNNWSSGIPTSGQSIWISNSLSNYPIINTIEQITLNNAVVSNNASLTIKSDATGTGSLIVNGTVSGDVTVERYIAAASWASGTDGWHLLSSPVASQAISGVWTPDGNSSNNYDFYAWNEANNIWVNHKNTTTSPTWTETNGDNNFTVGRGYIVAYQAESTNTFVGTPNKDDVVVNTLTRTTGAYADTNDAGFNVLGNPFPSAIQWNDGNWTLTNISTTAKLWNSGNKSYDDLGASGIIPANNGFVVQLTSGTTGSITIPAASRTHSATNWYKTNENQRIKLIAREADGSSAQSSNLVLNEQATDSYDPIYDAIFLPGYAPHFYSTKESKNLSTYAISDFDEEMMIPYGFVSNGATSFEIELIESIDNQPIFLTDNKTGTIHKLSENPVYSFTASEGDNPNRFLLHFGMVGIGEQEQAPTLQAYMVDNRLYVNNSLEQSQLAIYDLQGRLVAEQSLNSGGLQSLPLDLPVGMYIVRLNNASESHAVKINVQ